MTNIYIFNNASRAAGYGIGTYIKQLAEGLSVMPETKVSLVEMYADTKEFAISDDKDGIRHYLIPSCIMVRKTRRTAVLYSIFLQGILIM